MKKALISTNEIVITVDGKLGKRVCEVADRTFEVCPQLVWMDCDDSVVADVYYWDDEQQAIILKPVPPPEPVEPIEPTEP